MSKLRDVLIGAALAGLSYSELARLKSGWNGYKEFSKFEKLAATFQGKAVTILDKDYPEKLMILSRPPIVLFYKGDLDLTKKPSVAIVGTRRATRYGLEVASHFASGLSRLGIVIVSGLARGIDAAAHSSIPPELAIGVLGNGYDVFYPSSSRRLQQRISKEGLIVTEYAPDVRGSKWSYVARDRIIAALSDMVVVVESPLGGGALHTANFAMEMGIPVGAVPGDIFRHQALGSNELLKDGAHVITSVDDIIGILGLVKSTPSDFVLSPEEEKVLQALATGDKDIYTLSRDVGISVGKLLAVITRLESKGLVSFDGNSVGRRM